MNTRRIVRAVSVHPHAGSVMTSSYSVDALETPIPFVDLDRMRHNLDRMAEYTGSHALALRPHIKTHKSPTLAAEQMERGAVGLTCATTREADVMSGAAADLLVMYPPVGAPRLSRLMALSPDVRLTVALDSVQALEPLVAAARPRGRSVRVMVELDTGMRRVGVRDGAEAVALARAIHDAGAPLEFAGLAFYPGHVRERVEEQGEKLRALSRQLDDVVSALTRAGLPPPVVSGGSTPAAWRMHELPAVTEVRPGTYIFNDRTTAAIGACADDDCALTVLATVVSRAVPGQAVVDAGSKALGREPLPPELGDGFAAVLGEPRAVVRAMSEEHGVIDLQNSRWQPRVGERVQLVPNHVCVVVHLNDVLVMVRGSEVISVLEVAARGRHGPAVSGDPAQLLDFDRRSWKIEAMTSQLAKELAERFAEDAETLRARAAAPATGVGPDPATSERMADACDRVSALFASAQAADDSALAALAPVLERYERDERELNSRAVYRGARMRLRDALGTG